MLVSRCGRHTLQVEAPEPVLGSGKFYYPDGATYEGGWLLVPEPESAEEEAEAEASAPAEDAAPGAEETPEEKEPEAEKEDEQPAEPKGTYYRHGRGKYAEGDYSYDGEWEHVRFLWKPACTRTYTRTHMLASSRYSVLSLTSATNRPGTRGAVLRRMS